MGVPKGYLQFMAPWRRCVLSWCNVIVIVILLPDLPKIIVLTRQKYKKYSEVVVVPFVCVSFVIVFVFVSLRLSEGANDTGANTERPCRVTLFVRDASAAAIQSA